MKLRDYPEKVQPYVFHGMEVALPSSGSAKGDCPFCGKSGHFGINTSTGQFRCVRCETIGNIYSFLELLHKLAVENYDSYSERLAEFAEDRTTTPEVMRLWGVALNPLTDDWLIPGHNSDLKMSNLYKVVISTDETGKVRHQCMGTPGCKPQPMGVQTLTPKQKTRAITEGPWDGMSLHAYLLQHERRGDRMVRIGNPKSSLSQTFGVWSAPGAGLFQPEWFKFTDGCDNMVLFDNDHPKIHPTTKKHIMQGGVPLRPGWNGQQRVFSMIAASDFRPNSFRQICWGQGEPGVGPLSTPGHNPELADGYDIRDCIKDRRASALPYIEQLLVKYVPPRRTRTGTKKEEVDFVEPITCTTFEDLCRAFEAHLHFSDQMRDTLAIMLAVILSTEFPEDPIFLRVIGPPGSGKTTLAECVSVARRWVVPISKLTGFHSGYVDQGDKERDVSPLTEFLGKTCIVKDADPLVKSSSRDTVMSELRDIFDGSSRVRYRNDKKNTDFESIRLTFILCGTGSLRALSKDTYLGERFLDCEIMDDTFDTAPILRRARATAWASFSKYHSSPKNGEAETHEVQSDDSGMILKQTTYGFIKYLKENFKNLPAPVESEEAGLIVEALAQFLAYMRARVQRTGEHMDYRPQIEVAGRLTKQLTKMVFTSALVLGKTTVDDEVMGLIRKIMLDTCRGFQYEITKLLIDSPHGLTAMQIRSHLQLPETSVRRWTIDMQELGIIVRSSVSNNSGQRGRDSHVWKLSPKLRAIWDIAQGVKVEPKKAREALSTRRR